MSQQTKPLSTVEKTFVIIDLIKNKGQAGVSELAKETSLPESTVHSHLTTLEQVGYLVNENGSYRLSPLFLALGEKARNQYTLYTRGKSEVRQLADDTGEVASIAVHERGQGIFLWRLKGENAASLESYDGYTIDLHTTAVGKAMLSGFSDERVDEIIDEHGLTAKTTNTITDRDTLFKTLDDIRDSGVAYDREERVHGLHAVAAPVSDGDGRIMGAVSVAGPSGRLQNQHLEEYGAKVKSSASMIELNMSYR
ncbi:IclR family transcriptional regulator [Halorientalis marina]|uniref:IclR family transcriptional regulator n=1 Tax=Halorientalis marina TaxID=2931976 RepID=UPI001FF1BEA8|nr:IclR family transcriptional regulator [Halorientalis marina]